MSSRKVSGRDRRRELAEETVDIVERGRYRAGDGSVVRIGDKVQEAREGTRLYRPEDVDMLPIPKPLDEQSGDFTLPVLELTAETTCEALYRLRETASRERDSNGEPFHLACLNFASARNPGGGFLTGAQAQEESLARSSALYACELAQPEYYQLNRAAKSLQYLDNMIWSPAVPFFRLDNGYLMPRPCLVSVITAPAPNVSDIAHHPDMTPAAVRDTLERRAAMVLRIAFAQGVTHLVLGAWGCGVFRNDPEQVAEIFGDLLLASGDARNGRGAFAGAFRHITFAVYDATPTRANYKAFEKVFGR